MSKTDVKNHTQENLENYHQEKSSWDSAILLAVPLVTLSIVVVLLSIIL